MKKTISILRILTAVQRLGDATYDQVAEIVGRSYKITRLHIHHYQLLDFLSPLSYRKGELLIDFCIFVVRVFISPLLKKTFKFVAFNFPAQFKPCEIGMMPYVNFAKL